MSPLTHCLRVASGEGRPYRRVVGSGNNRACSPSRVANGRVKCSADLVKSFACRQATAIVGSRLDSSARVDARSSLHGRASSFSLPGSSRWRHALGCNSTSSIASSRLRWHATGRCEPLGHSRRSRFGGYEAGGSHRRSSVPSRSVVDRFRSWSAAFSRAFRFS